MERRENRAQVVENQTSRAAATSGTTAQRATNIVTGWLGKKAWEGGSATRKEKELPGEQKPADNRPHKAIETWGCEGKSPVVVLVRIMEGGRRPGRPKRAWLA